MKTTHTPGPWGRNIKPATKYPVVFAGRNTHVAMVDTRLPADEVEANIRLIAAAPDLLAVLRDELDAIRLWRKAVTDSDVLLGIDISESKILDAIAKAEEGNAGCDKCGMFDRAPGSNFCKQCGAQ